MARPLRSSSRCRSGLRALAGLALSVAALLSSAGCASKADSLTQDAVEALDRCDIREAHGKFAEARAEDGEHPQAALGFALTDVALLVESEPMQRVFADIGFTAPFDAEKVLFGRDGVLARAARHDSCDSVEDFLNHEVPYPPLLDDALEPRSLLKPGLLVDDLLLQARALDGRLADEVSALVVAADKLDGPVTFDAGTCGIGKVALAEPELYLAAGFIELVRATTLLAAAYDWALPLDALLADDDASLESLAALLNQHLGRVDDAAQAALAKERLQAALGLFSRGLASARAKTSRLDGALVDWSAVPDAMFDDGERLLQSLTGSLSQPTPLADMSPPVSAQFGVEFSSPIDFTSLGGPLFSVVTNEFGERNLTLDDERFEAAFDRLMTPGPSLLPDGLTWGPSDRWEDFDADPVFDPQDRFGEAFDCTSIAPSGGSVLPAPAPPPAP